jgi:mannose-6-phosphate isomerase-like protein (cupin superfamily)
MSVQSIFVSGTNLAFVASGQGTDRRYVAIERVVEPCAQAQAGIRDHAVTVFFVQDGIVEFMVNGATASVKAGAFVRVPANHAFAYRNLSSAPARLFTQTIPVGECSESQLKLVIELAA